MRRRLLLAAVALPGLFTAPALAQTAAIPPTAETNEVSEVVVTAAPYGVSADSATTSVNTLDREDLDVLPPQGLGDTLNGLPGLRSTAYGPGASRPVIRGLSGPRVLVLQNGVGLVDASALSPDHAVASDPGGADRIEVLRGPSTLIYGGSAIGGVVNVIDDRIPSRFPADGFDGHASASWDSVDQGRAGSAHLRTGAGRWAFAFDVAARESEDYETPDGEVENSDVSLQVVGGGLSYIADAGFLGLSVTRTTTDYGIPFAEHDHEDEEHEEEEGEGHGHEGPIGIELEQTRVDLRGEYRFSGQGVFDRVRLSAGLADYEHREILRETGEVGTRFLSDGAEARLELVQTERDGWRGAVGVQGLVRSLEAIGDEAFIPPVDISEAAVFTLQRLDRGSWGLEGGARLDRRTLESPDAERDFTNGSVTGAVFARPAPGWFVSLAAAYNRRAPTETELFADGPHPGTGTFELGDPSLDSESVISLEGTVRYRGARARLEGHVFVASYRDFIEQAPTGEEEDELPVFRYFATDADFVGAEVSGWYGLWRAGERRLTVEGAFDVVRGESDEGSIARVPPWSATAGLAYADTRWEARAEVRRVGEQDRTADFETPTNGYTLVNAFASWRPPALDGVRLFVDARNLTDELAREHVSFLKDVAPLPGRSIRVGVAASF